MDRDMLLLIFGNLILMLVILAIHQNKQNRMERDIEMLRHKLVRLENMLPTNFKQWMSIGTVRTTGTMSISPSASPSPSPSPEIPKDEDEDFTTFLRTSGDSKLDPSPFKDPNRCAYCNQPFEDKKDVVCPKCGAPRR